MTAVTLANLAAWMVQTALIVGAGLTALWLVRLEAPAVRYLFLRALLAICLALPFLQPRVAAARQTSRAAPAPVLRSRSFPARPAPRRPPRQRTG